jgi:GH15 family glucan-1,4-alpha-glucosidase
MDLGIIGNNQYNALVDKAGRVVWLCWPRFDSTPIFAHLLDSSIGGHFQICPASNKYRVSQVYVQNTNILETTFITAQGTYKVIDFAPRFFQFDRYYKPTMMIRIVKKIEGEPQIRVTCHPTVNYGQLPTSTHMESNHIVYDGFDQHLRLTTNASLTYVSESKAFSLNRTKYFVLTWGQPLERNIEETCENFYNRTKLYWQRWVKHCAIPKDYQSEVIRSALVTKLHQFDDTGAIIAASTTSIPEAQGTSRNWDYRYCWLRDAYFSLNAFQQLGQFEEMEQFVSYLRHICKSGLERLQPVYALNGDPHLEEKTLDHLQGYENHKPVRIGNHAYTHIQNDVYGEMILAISPLFLDKRLSHTTPHPNEPLLTQLLQSIDTHLEEPDAGLWEFRGKKDLHAFSLLMHWVGAKKTLEIATIYGYKNLKVMAQGILERSSKLLESKCWRPHLKTFVQSEKSENLDASLLMLINLGYLSPQDTRAKDLIHKIMTDLKTKDDLVYRYKHDDDFGSPKNTFTICSFWLAEALARCGRMDEAHQCFEKITSLSNHLGLMSEDIDPKTHQQWGNFPQVYSHVGLINSAFLISRSWT